MEKFQGVHSGGSLNAWSDAWGRTGGCGSSDSIVKLIDDDDADDDDCDDDATANFSLTYYNINITNLT